MGACPTFRRGTQGLTPVLLLSGQDLKPEASMACLVLFPCSAQKAGHTTKKTTAH